MISFIKSWWLDFKNNKLKTFASIASDLIPIIIMKESLYQSIQRNWTVFIIVIVLILFINQYLNTEENLQFRKEISNRDEQIFNITKKNNMLKTNLDEIGRYIDDMPDLFLASVSEFLGLKNHDRISLYLFDDVEFKIIGRYSLNPKYNARVRSSYPRNEGYISKAFSNDDGKPYYYRDKLPPPSSPNYIKQVQKDCNISKDTIDKLTMKSRTYFCRLVSDTNQSNMGILVIESTNTNLHISKENLNEKLEELIIPHLISIIEISNKMIRKTDIKNKTKGNTNEE